MSFTSFLNQKLHFYLMKLVFTPDWFLGADVLINLISFFILIAFFILCTQSYKINKKKPSMFLGVGFLLIALAQLASILTKIVLYYDTTFTQTIGQAVITYNVVKSVDIFYHTGFFFHKLLTLAGLFIIYKLPLKKEMRKDFLLMFYLLIVSALLSASMHYIFHLTAIILIFFIIRNYSVIYRKNKNKNTKLLICGFYALAISQVIFMFSMVGPLYVVSNIIELIGYLIFLVVIKRIFFVSKRLKKR